MIKHLQACFDYLQYKIIAGLMAIIFNEDFFKLLLPFIALELIDIYTAWLAQSCDLWKKTYPQTPGSIWKYTARLWHAHKWRWINSARLRHGFTDKMLVYLLLLLTGAFVDAAFFIGHAPRLLSSIIVVVLSSTEALSIMENLSMCDVTVVSDIRQRFQEAVKKK